MSFREMQESHELFGEHLVDFKYILFDVNRYSDEELFEIGNLMSSVFAIDKNEDAKVLIDKLKRTIRILKNSTPDQWVRYKRWLKRIFSNRFDDEQIKNEIIENSDIVEVDYMVMNLEVALDRWYDEGIEKGIQKGRIDEKVEIAKKLFRIGLPIAEIAEVTGLKEAEILSIPKQ